MWSCVWADISSASCTASGIELSATAAAGAGSGAAATKTGEQAASTAKAGKAIVGLATDAGLSTVGVGPAVGVDA